MPTNGFDINTILPLLRKRIGFREESGFTIIDDLKQSLSGRYFQSFHPAVTLQNIKETMNVPPADDGEFNDYLAILEDDAIAAMLNAVFNKPQLIESGLLFKRYAESNLQTTPNAGKAVGYRLKLSQKPCSLQINSVAFRFTKDATLTLYLFCDSKAEPLFQKSFSVTGNDETVVDLIDDNWIINSNSAAYKDRNFYLVYFQDDLVNADPSLTSEAINVQVECFNETYMYCANGVEMEATGSETFDKANRGYSYKTYGMLPEISVYRDFTPQIKAQAHIFDEAIGKQLAVKVIEQVLASTASNLTQRITKEQLNGWMADLNIARPTEERPFMPGLKSQYEKELKRLNETFFEKPVPVSVSLCS